MRIAILTISDRASRGEYEDLSGPAIEDWLRNAVSTPMEIERRVVSDGVDVVRDELLELCDKQEVGMVLTTGGTGPAPRDLTPEAMQQVVSKPLPGFGELMRRTSLDYVPTAILSRQEAGVRGRTFILNLPGSPASIDVCLKAVFPAVPYCLELIDAGFLDTHPAVLKSHRPKR